ncbi:hypothetical protein McanCB21832_007745 [Microsporum canis]
MIPYILIHVLSLSVAAEGAVVKRWLNGSKPTDTVDPGVTPGCTYWINGITAADQCADIVGYFGITEEQFNEWNPALNGHCGAIQPGHSYCVMADQVPTSTKLTSTAPPSPTTSSTATSPTATGPSPTQSGLAQDCNKFYKVVAGDSCYDIAQREGASLEDFYKWNPKRAVGTTCGSLWGGYYVCVGVKGQSPTQSSSPPASTPTAPQPQQPGIAKNCNKFHLVKSGESCWSIETEFSISHDDFLSWNTGVGSSCNLWAGYNVCVSVPGSTSTTTPTTVPGSPTPTPTAPQPQLPGVIKECKKYYKVQKGDTCWSIGQMYKINDDTFRRWNPIDCSKLWLGYYICISA